MHWVKPSLICIVLHLTSTISNSEILPGISVCGKHPHDRIYGGQQTDITEFPWMAILEYNLPNTKHRFRCGGSLITKRHVLTAAHCITDKLVNVRLGEHNLKTDPDCEDTTPGLEYCADPPKNIGIEKTYVPEPYQSEDRNHHGDIAIIKLKEDVDFSNFIIPICLPLSEELKNKLYAGKNLTVAGWGRTEDAYHSDVKLKVELPVLSDASCSEYYKKFTVNISGGQLCAGGQKGKDSCTGDSGGPLMHLHRTRDEENWYVIGLVSFGTAQCGRENSPAVYTRVPYFDEWILNTLKL
ncbi:hypothetical protein ILUMI_22474 [Ignelater luminosus]|uniref:Peptidase S1 domain-containing protein n=1 Tax=Ignelater luminosus TaxID=2038154 RepID=A0A8K0CEE8_IGNLU|nr:hypothetical protein ILUMI_22474 [Ignelater luminosus]